MKGARDAHRLRAEVDRDRARFRPDDATHAVRVVIDQVAALELLDDRLGVRLEGAVGEMSPPRGRGCNYCQYVPLMSGKEVRPSVFLQEGDSGQVACSLMGRAQPWEVVGTRDSGAPTHPHIGRSRSAASADVADLNLQGSSA